MNAGTAQQYARWTAVLYAITIVVGGWGEAHVPSTLLIANDPAGTAQRVASSVGIFRASFAAYLIEAACDITLNALLYQAAEKPPTLVTGYCFRAFQAGWSMREVFPYGGTRPNRPCFVSAGHTSSYVVAA